jgi:hypothetical protein
MFMKKKEEKDLSWYQDKLAQLDEELYVVRKEYENYLAKRYYPEFKDKIGRYYKSEHRYSSRSPFYEYHVLLDVRPEDLYISSDGEVLAKCRTSSVSRDGNGCIRINLSEEAHVHYLGEEISEREYKDAVSSILFDAACVLPSLKISE